MRPFTCLFYNYVGQHYRGTDGTYTFSQCCEQPWREINPVGTGPFKQHLGLFNISFRQLDPTEVTITYVKRVHKYEQKIIFIQG